jgi:hypothetical protein
MGPTIGPAPSASNVQYLPDGTAVQGTGDLRGDAGELPNGDGEVWWFRGAGDHRKRQSAAEAFTMSVTRSPRVKRCGRRLTR